MPLSLSDLTETVTRLRTTGTSRTPRGKVLADKTNKATLRCLIQPHHGTLQYTVAGAVQRVTDALYCNLPADINVLDTIVRASGEHLRVAFVADEGGQGDHLKVFLVGVNSGEAQTGD